jgi:hypothetical protein
VVKGKAVGDLPVASFFTIDRVCAEAPCVTRAPPMATLVAFFRRPLLVCFSITFAPSKDKLKLDHGTEPVESRKCGSAFEG